MIIKINNEIQKKKIQEKKDEVKVKEKKKKREIPMSI